MNRRAILIMCDTQRADMLGCYGNKDMLTPNIDRLAREGVQFSRAYTCQPVCGPARAAIFTGLYPHSCGSWTNSYALSDNVKTIGQRLSRASVPCAYVGKWHLDGGDYFGLGKCPDGWDERYWYDMRNFLYSMPEEKRRASRDGRTQVTAEETYAYQCAQKAIDYIRLRAEGDFFLTLSFDEPHGPSLCPEPYASMYKDYAWRVGESWNQELSSLPAHIRAWAGSAMTPTVTGEGLARFLGCASFVDAQVGRVLAEIDRLCPDALVLYTSDHGDGMGAHRIWNKGPAIYDEVTRIPLLARGKGVPAGAVNPRPASHIDITPTILDYFGCPPATWCEGESMLDAIYRPQTHGRERVFFEFGRYEVDHDGFGGFQPYRCVFDGRFKLGVHLLSDDELYDLQNDPHELRNLIYDEAYAAQRDALHDALLDFMNHTRDPFRGYYWERRPWRKDASAPSWGYTGMTRQRNHTPFEPCQLDYSTGMQIEETERVKPD